MDSNVGVHVQETEKLMSESVYEWWMVIILCEKLTSESGEPVELPSPAAMRACHSVPRESLP